MTLSTILAIVALILGPGGAAVILFLLKRRPELRKLDATSGADALKSANEYIKTLQAGEKSVRADMERIALKVTVLETQLVAERLAATEALASSQREIGRLSAELARVRTDLAVTQAEMIELTRRMADGRRTPDPLTA